jgi:hypothetical protein
MSRTVTPRDIWRPLMSRPLVALSIVIAASTLLLVAGHSGTALGFLVYYSGYALVVLLAGASYFPDAHRGLLNFAVACVNTSAFAVAASLILLPLRTHSLTIRWVGAIVVAVTYLAFLFVFVRSPWSI